MKRAYLLFFALAAVLAFAAFACIGEPPIPPLAADDGGCDACAIPDGAVDATTNDAPAPPDAPPDAPADVVTDAGLVDAADGAAGLHSFPLHTSPTYYLADAAALPDGVTDVDTSNLLLKVNGGAPALPAGVEFQVDGNGSAVLSIGAWHVTKDVKIHGARALIVVAAGAVTVDAVLHGEAARETPGPGGSAPTAYGVSPSPRGGGANGTANGGGTGGSGGGGGGFGSAGAAGGKDFAIPGGAGGQSYGSQVADFGNGGGGGWGGSDPSCGVLSMGIASIGGASGGVIQISSAVSIAVSTTGGVHVGGGGGNGGCSQRAGGGGGSGGLIFLEAPSITTAGWLAANGGGGGSGSLDVSNAVPGADATMSMIPAPGGKGSSLPSGGSGAAGLADGGVVAATVGGADGSYGSGGSGGGVGRIWLRTRAPATQDATKITPAAQLDATL